MKVPVYRRCGNNIPILFRYMC